MIRSALLRETFFPHWMGAISPPSRDPILRALARAITLVESTRADHREQAVALLAELAPAVRAARDELLAPLSEPEQDQLRDLLIRLNQEPV